MKLLKTNERFNNSLKLNLKIWKIYFFFLKQKKMDIYGIKCLKITNISTSIEIKNKIDGKIRLCSYCWFKKFATYQIDLYDLLEKLRKEKQNYHLLKYYEIYLKN